MLKTYKYPLLGALIALVLTLMLLTFGFFKSLLLVFMVLVGGFLGHFAEKSGFVETYLHQLKK